MNTNSPLILAELVSPRKTLSWITGLLRSWDIGTNQSLEPNCHVYQTKTLHLSLTVESVESLLIIFMELAKLAQE